VRKLSNSFMNDLLNEGGALHSILHRVKLDHTLMLSIRQDYINIYYRGGNLLKVEEQGNRTYRTFFDYNYNKLGAPVPDLPNTINNKDEAREWVSSFQILKGIMDIYFSEYSKPEREFQQLIARENNFSNISNQSEYFISDIEFADSGLGARFDMLAIRWLASQRKKGNKCKAVFMEMKYADGALDGSAGLLKHLRDFDDFISNSRHYSELLLNMDSQFDQLDQLGLLKFNKGKSNAKVKLDDREKPEVIFILANHNPRSTKLSAILNDPQVDTYDQSQHFDLRFYVSSFAGYALHSDCMLSLSQFRELLKRKNSKQGVTD